MATRGCGRLLQLAHSVETEQVRFEDRPDDESRTGGVPTARQEQRQVAIASGHLEDSPWDAVFGHAPR